MNALYQSRSLIWLLVKRDLRTRYAGSLLGSFWNVIHPLFLIAIYILVFSSVMSKVGGGMSRGAYVVHLCSGLIPWLVFSETLVRCTGVLGENANFIKKLPFPLEILPLSALINSLVIHMVSLVALIGLLSVFGYSLDARVLVAPFLLVGVGMTAMGLGMMLSVLNLYLKDIGQLTTLALQVMFWLLPIVYVPAVLPGFVNADHPGTVFRLISHNPLLGYVSAMQEAFGSPQAVFYVEHVYVMVLLPFLCLWLGHAVMTRQRSELLDLL